MPCRLPSRLAQEEAQRRKLLPPHPGYLWSSSTENNWRLPGQAHASRTGKPEGLAQRMSLPHYITVYQHDGFNQSRDRTNISHSFSRSNALLDEEPFLFLFYFLQHFFPHCWHFLWGQKLGLGKHLPPVPNFTWWCLNCPEQPHLELPPPPPIGLGPVLVPPCSFGTKQLIISVASSRPGSARTLSTV